MTSFESLSLRFNRITKEQSDEIQKTYSHLNPVVIIYNLKGPLKTIEDKKKYNHEYYQKKKSLLLTIAGDSL